MINYEDQLIKKLIINSIKYIHDSLVILKDNIKNNNERVIGLIIILILLIFSYSIRLSHLKSIDEWVYLYHIKWLNFSEMWIPSYTYFVYQKLLNNLGADLYLISRISNSILLTLSLVLLYRVILKDRNIINNFNISYLIVLFTPAIYYVSTLTPEIISFSLIVTFFSCMYRCPKSYFLHLCLLILIVTTKVQLLVLAVAYLITGIYDSKRVIVFIGFSILYILFYFYMNEESGKFAASYKDIFSYCSQDIIIGAILQLLAYMSVILIYSPPWISFKVLTKHQKSIVFLGFIFLFLTLILVSYFTSLASYEQGINGIKIHSRYLQGALFFWLASWVFLPRKCFNNTSLNKIFLGSSLALFIFTTYWVHGTPLSTFDAPEFSLIHQSNLTICAILLIRSFGFISFIYFESIKIYKFCILLIMVFCFYGNVIPYITRPNPDKLEITLNSINQIRDFNGKGLIFSDNVVDTIRIKFHMSNVNFDEGGDNLRKCTDLYDICIGYKINYECNFINQFIDNVSICFK